MEFPLDVNYLLPYEVTIVNGDYRVLNPGPSIRILASEQLSLIIDVMGDASYKAQGLAGPVTTARKFRQADQRLYIIKKTHSISTRPDHYGHHGAVVGILKVGAKHLYIYDEQGQVHERTPLCVLDFYVHESQQRLGYGKRLFDTMLDYEKCFPHDLAIDRPSNKCLAFLHKHYHLTSPIYQVNNFVVYPGFFQSKTKSKSEDEFHSWLFPSSSPRRPFSEQIDTTHRSRMALNEEEFFSPRRSGTSLIRTTSNLYPIHGMSHSALNSARSSSWRLFGLDRSFFS